MSPRRTATRLAASALALYVCGRAAASPGMRPDPMQPMLDLFGAQRYAEVVAALSGPGLHKLPSREVPLAYDLLGQAQEKLGHVDDAIAVYELAQGLYPKDINVLSHLGALLHHAGLDDRAAPLFERVLRIHPKNAQANAVLADIERRQGFLDRATAHYEAALAGWDGNAALWRDFAEALAARRDFARAETAIQKSLSLSSDVDAIVDLALFQYGAGDRAKAMRTLEMAMAAGPSRADVAERRALWLLEDGRLEDCLEASEALIAAAPKDPLPLWLRARVRLRQGRAPEARRDLETAAALGQDAPFVAAVARETLDRLRKDP